MRKNMKKLISALLAASMLLGSLGAVAFADDETNTGDTPAATSGDAVTTPDADKDADNSPEPEQSAEPEASAEPTAEPTATPEPTSAPITDSYYAEAIGLLSAMGIFQGDDNGDFKPDSTISRAEMSAVIMRTLNRTAMSSYKGIFTDVADSHWAASTIQTAFDSGVINGMGDGTFYPDGDVTYEQAVKMIVCALNYSGYAEANGGYPTGYMLTANMKDVEITKNASGTVGEPAKRSVVAKLIYNALNADYPTITGYESGYPKYTTNEGKTLASEMHDIYVHEGVLTATSLKTIDASVTPKADQVAVDGELYTNKLSNAEDLVANYVKLYYYDEDNKGSDMEAIYAFPVTSKNKTATLDAKSIEQMTNLQSSSRGEIRYEDEKGATKTYRTVESPILVLNGQLFNEANEDMNVYDEDGVATGEVYTLEEYLTPDVGSITLKDFNNDGYYDVVMVDKYQTIVVTSASEKLVAGKFNKKLDVDTTNDDVIVSVTKDGTAVRTRNLKKMDIATVIETINNDGDRVVTIDVSTKTATGAIDTLDTDKGRTYITVDGTEYEVDSNAVKDINVGSESTLYLDKFGRVAYIESTAGGKLSGNEKYAWLMNLYESEDGESLEIKLYTQEGKVLTADLASTLRYSGNVGGQYTVNTTIKTGEAESKRMLKNAAKALDNLSMDAGYPIKLIKYATNSNGQINKLVMPTTDAAQTDGVVVGKTNYRSTMSVDNIVASKYSISTSTVEFTVPRTADDMRTSSSAYAAGSVTPDHYMGREGVSEDFILAEFDGNKAGVLVKYVIGSSTAADSSYDTADNTPIGIITGFTTQYDEDEDEIVYGIKISTNGTETEYTTKKETTVAEQDESNLDNSSIFRTVGGKVLWNMSESAPGINSIRDALSVGDIVGYKTSGSKLDTIVRIVDMSEFAKGLNAGEDVATAMNRVAIGNMGVLMNGANRSKDRDAFVFAQVSEVDIDDTVVLTVDYPRSATGEQDLVSVDSSKIVDVYEYSTDKTDTDESSGIFVGDIVFVKYYRGSVQQVIVIR